MGTTVDQLDVGTLDIYFNELSIRKAENKAIARNWLKDLVALWKIASGMGFTGFRTTGSLVQEQIAENYSIGDWLVDKEVDLDMRRLFRGQFLKYPFIGDVLESKSRDGQKLFEFKYKDSTVYGLGAAYLFESLAASFDNAAEWDNTRVHLTVFSYSEDIKGIVQENGYVNHACKPVHLQRLRDWISGIKKRAVPDGRILWEKRKEFFPHLVFCEFARKQVLSLSDSHPEFIQVKKRLFELEDYFSHWQTGPFEADSLPSKITVESDDRRKRFRSQLTFACEDGKERPFSWHCRYTPGPGRLYFYPDEKTRKCHIGYIGPKIM